jgi:hypothetical protein
MRLIVAIVLLAISTLTLGFGIAESTIFKEPETFDRSVVLEGSAPAVVIHGSTLAAYPGRPTIEVEGGVSGRVPTEDGTGFEIRESDRVFVAYARTIDVLAWLSPARHTQVRFDAQNENLVFLPRSGSDIFLPDPQGSDLWFQEYDEQGSVTISASIPADVSLLIMTDGVLPAPPNVTVSWPLLNEDLWSLVLVIVGIGSFVVGVSFLILSGLHWRRTRGPRRKSTRRPSAPRRIHRQKPRSSVKPRGRRAHSFIALPLVVGLGLTGCQSTNTDAGQNTETTPVGQTTSQAPYPSVTELQFSRILTKVSEQIQQADEELSINTLSARVTDPVLQARRASYIIKRADAESGTLVPVPSSPVRLVLPQQTTTWPRSVFGIIQDEQDRESPSLAVVLRQESPREPYLLTYAVVLAPQIQLPDLPSASVGAAKLSRDSKLTRISPAEVLEHYSDAINLGQESVYASEFSLATDRLFSLLGPAAQALRQESFGEAVEVTWNVVPLEGEIVALGTSNGGALVLGTLEETETVRPVQVGATVNSSIAVRALTSLSQSTRGFEVVSNIQMLWYVPPVGSEEGIQVLGHSYNLVQAREIDSD